MKFANVKNTNFMFNWTLTMINPLNLLVLLFLFSLCLQNQQHFHFPEKVHWVWVSMYTKARNLLFFLRYWLYITFKKSKKKFIAKKIQNRISMHFHIYKFHVNFFLLLKTTVIPWLRHGLHIHVLYTDLHFCALGGDTTPLLLKPSLSGDQIYVVPFPFYCCSKKHLQIFYHTAKETKSSEGLLTR